MEEKFLVGIELRGHSVDGNLRFYLGKRIAIASKNIHHFEEVYLTQHYSDDVDKYTDIPRIKNIILNKQYLGTQVFYSKNNSPDCQELESIIIVESFDECIYQIKK